ncbi:hypothetical protein EDB19DRAFT_1721801 [Suillus lakei]|nr:hypothetical protein EDB19DRAFT_1721801 [Suillus lakei]
MSDRSVRYFELSEWLETISNHKALSSVMPMPTMMVPSVKSVAPKKVARVRHSYGNGPSSMKAVLAREAMSSKRRLLLKGWKTFKFHDLEALEMTKGQNRMASSAKGKSRHPCLTRSCSCLSVNVGDCKYHRLLTARNQERHIC